MKYPSKKYAQFVLSMKTVRYLFINRVENELDNLIVITGSRGSGKSTFAVKYAKGFEDLEKLELGYNQCLSKEEEVKPLEGYSKFSMRRDIVYSIQELESQIMDSRKGICIGDEAVTSAARRNAMTRGNKKLHQILTINRKNKNTIFLLLPNIEDLDSSILPYLTAWIHVDTRGVAVLFLPNNTSIFGKKRWDLDASKKIYDKIMEENPTISKPPYWVFSNFRGYIKFGKMSKKREELYLELAHEKKNIEAKLESSKTSVSKERTEIKNKITDIANKLINGEIVSSIGYYKNCAELQINKGQLNRRINDELLLMGSEKTASKLLSLNKSKKSSVDVKKTFQPTRI